MDKLKMRLINEKNKEWVRNNPEKRPTLIVILSKMGYRLTDEDEIEKSLN